jgi:hypothetical protein
MFFKLTARNPYRDLIRNVRRIIVSPSSNAEKLVSFKELYTVLKPKLLENERYLNTQAAFAQRCEHWNQRDVVSIKPVTNQNNPWLQFKREFEQAITAEDSYEQRIKTITIALAWFYTNEYKDDWIAD